MPAWTLKNADIIQALPILANHYEKADSGSTTSLTCGRLVDLVQEEVEGATIAFIAGANAGEDATITSYTYTTGECGFDALSTSVDASTGFGIVYMSYSGYINRAFDIIRNEMRNRGLDSDLFKTTAQVKELHLTKTLQLICMAKRQDADTDDIFHESYLAYKEAYESEITTLKADYDLDEDGTIEESEKKVSSQVVLRK